MTRVPRIAAVLAFAFWTGTGRADEPSAADRETARDLLHQADAAMAQHDIAKAHKAYAGADAIMHLPTTSIEVARTDELLGNLVEAGDRYAQIARSNASPGESPKFAEARAAAAEAGRKLLARIPSVTINVTGVAPDAKLDARLDDRSLNVAALGLPRKVNPGAHVLVVSAPGYAAERRELQLAEGEAKTVDVALHADAQASSAASGDQATTTGPNAQESAPPGGGDKAGGFRIPLPSWIGFGVAVAGLGVGTATGIVALSNASTAKGLCNVNLCPPAAQPDISTSNDFAHVATASFIIAGVGAAVGVIWLIVDNQPKKAANHVGVDVGPGSLFVHGTF